MANRTRPLWAGGYRSGPDPDVARLSVSVRFDKRLAPFDIAGSIAHAEMLGRAGIIPKSSSRNIVKGLRRIYRKIAEGDFRWESALEDVHMNIEAALTREIGEDGKRLHTGRSRNDQVATTFRLYCAEAARGIRRETAALGATLAKLALRHAHLLWPGTTHLQPAQPVTFGHLLAAHAVGLRRDCERLAEAEREALSACPLGSGALAGSTLPLDRTYVARRLGFAAPSANTQDAVADRDFALALLFALSVLSLHLARLGEEIVRFAAAGLLRLDERVTTGSSLMPQKKNPDAAELARAKANRTWGGLLRLAMTLKGLPFAYNRDLQEDKEAVFDAVDAMQLALPALRRTVQAAKPDAARARAQIPPETLATDFAEWLVARGTPFRKAHERAAALASRAARDEIPFDEAARKVYPEAAEVLELGASVARRNLPGGPAPERVREVAEDLAAFFQKSRRGSSDGAAKALSLLE